MVFDSFCKINISYGNILVFLRNGHLLDLSTNCSCGHGCKRCCTLGPKSNNCLYGLGHVFNDLSASMWFSYLMLFFVSVLEMKATVAGTLMLLGQVVDALATPVVGIVADKYHTKKFWHLFGCILVSISFPLIFFRFWGLGNSDNNIIELVTPVYYSVLITFFQIGWTFVQISHLAMIPIISEDLSVRASLTSIRYIASVLSCLSVYIITWVVFRTDHSAVIGPPDDYKFKYIAIIVTAMGVATFLMFQILFTLNERSRSKGSSMDDDDESQENLMYFLKKPVLYKASFLYVFSRLYWALNIVYIPLFIEERLLINSENGSQLVATVPLVLYISSLCFSIFLKSKYNGMGHHVTYLFGSVLSLASALWVMFINPYTSIFHIYIIAILIGAGSSITFISSLCITSDLIGTNTTQGASIYSIVTFADKLITGIAIAVLEYMKCTDNKECPQYYKGVLTYPCGASVVLGLLSLLVSKIFGNKK